MGRRPRLLRIVYGARKLLHDDDRSASGVSLASNLLFCAYGMLAHIYPVMFLHMLLLPINLVKLWRLRFGGTRTSAQENEGMLRRVSGSS
jgi:hypothetical protein